MYFGFGGRERFVYSEQMPQPVSVGTLIFELVFFSFFVLAGVFLIYVAVQSYAPPKKLSAVCSGYHIKDNIGVIDNQARLEEALAEFEDKTGICPCIVTVNHEDWQEVYNNIEDAAFNEYVTRWDDEQHFLIFYSAAKGSPKTNWAWYDMSGDDTDEIITNSHFKTFQNDLQRYLSAENASVSDAFEAAFRRSLDYMMKPSGNEDSAIIVFMAIFWNGVTFFAIFNLISNFVKSRRKYVEVPDYYKSEVLQDYSKGYNPSEHNFD